MTALIHALGDFVAVNIPSWPALAAGGPLSLAWAYSALYLAGYLKRHKGWPTGYSRKLFHFTIFGTVAVLHSTGGTPAVCLFGAMTSLVVFHAVLLGDGHLLYEAMAREKDAPRRTWYIVIPYFATLVGGVCSSLLFGKAAVAGYLVAGLGDAIGEPAGVMFGKHRYRVPTFGRIQCTRSLEGSAAVCAVSIGAAFAALSLCGSGSTVGHDAGLALAIGAVSAGVEAVSPHGWDNATMQIVPSFLVGMSV